MPLTRRTLARCLAVFGAWTLFGLLIAQQTALQLKLRGEQRPLLSLLAPPLGGAWIWALYTPIVVAATRRLRRLRQRGWPGWVAYFAGHVVLASVLLLVGTVVWAAVRPYIDGTVTSWRTVFAYSILVDTSSYMAVAMLTEAAAFAAAYRERDREAAALARTAAELQERLDEARLYALETQLRPHFLHNTLNLIAELVHEEPDAADAMLTRLGLLLRRSYRAAAHLVPLGEELAFVLAYAEILERRYRDRVTLTVDVPDALRAHAVPAFSLQPLVENAFRHGVERREARTVVEIAGALRDGTLTLRVTDRPHGTSRWESSRELDRRRGGRAVRRDGDGVGLGNTRERLRALYGARAGLTLDRRPSETTATLWLPVSSGGDAGPAAEALASEMAAR